ncbi:hypothetical protein J7T55_011934 [Diaporthe amygdali]|uniref:uncharacterized protein n=1 Tax=Phomopsis amygdali TaxID=1214568 RepID=UPI0022FE274A|nr:uncharacterized protein J7T55_011934 [Diaporthe amygdali]KAJ0123469.1 hypothetical protein J7T55_011934 [Diaporthe amygdali]
MGNDDFLTDEHVADLLAKEAKDCSLKYSTMGMEAYTSSPSSSRPANKAKPNTRFLRNIIKGTEHHNKTLTAKELADSQARLKELADTEEEKRRKYKPTATEIRGRQLGNIAALLQGQPAQKRKRAAPTEEDITDLQKARAAEDARRLADTAAARKRNRGKDGRRRRSLERYDARKGQDGNGKDRARRANTSSGDEDRGVDDRKRRHRSRSPQSSSRKHRYRSPLRSKERERSARRTSNRRDDSTDPADKSSRRADNEEEDADSDPLEDLIGPAPPPKMPRGRGALRGVAGMDSRFSSDYDPKSDVQMETEDGRDDWDDALEALRDRARYRQQGADRLREAGFNEDQIKKWEKGDEKSIDDVQWTKAGEKREWDRGKDDDQTIDD